MNHVFNKLVKRSDDQSVAFKIRCTSCSTTGEVTINDTKVVLNEDGTKSTFDWSTSAYDTLGEFVDAINGKANWEAVIIDGLRADVTKSDWLDMISAAGTLTGSETLGATGSDGISFGWDSSVLHKYVVSIQEADLPSKTATVGRSDVEDKAIENVAYEIKAKLTDTNCTNTLTIYRCHGTTETAIHTITGLATSDEQTLFSSENVPLTAGDPETGGRLVCVLTCDTTHGTTWLEVRGQSINRVRQAMDGN